MSVPFPAPDGPETMMTRVASLPVQKLQQLRALSVGQAPDRLPLRYAAGVQESRRLDLPVLRDGHQHVKHLGRQHELRRIRRSRSGSTSARSSGPS